MPSAGLGVEDPASVHVLNFKPKKGVKVFMITVVKPANFLICDKYSREICLESTLCSCSKVLSD
jgi:hypothetical protein